MSLKRLIYYSAIIGGWSAFLGWLVAEVLLNRSGGGRMEVALTCALVGGAIGTGLNLVAGMANARLTQQIKRVVPGLLAGGVGGAVGGYIGDILFSSIHLPRAFGWMLMGAGIGVVEGLYERSPAKLRNGLIGGSVGGLVGGLLFDPIREALASNSAMSSRATAFVILGMCIGVLIGLVKVVFKEAWLTVLDGYRPGRQLILSEAQTVLGRAEYAALPFMGRGDAELEPEHARIVRQPDGRFAVEDNKTRQGTSVNNAKVNGRQALNDNDVIRIGVNSIRFSERPRGASGTSVPSAASAAPTLAPMRPYSPPPVPQKPSPRPVTPPPSVPPPEVKATPPVPAGPTVAPKPAPVPPQPSRPATPSPATASKPTPQPPAPPRPVTPAAPPPGPVPDGMVLCPNGHPVPKTQRYCIRCDINF